MFKSLNERATAMRNERLGEVPKPTTRGGTAALESVGSSRTEILEEAEQKGHKKEVLSMLEVYKQINWKWKLATGVTCGLLTATPLAPAAWTLLTAMSTAGGVITGEAAYRAVEQRGGSQRAAMLTAIAAGGAVATMRFWLPTEWIGEQMGAAGKQISNLLGISNAHALSVPPPQLVDTKSDLVATSSFVSPQPGGVPITDPEHPFFKGGEGRIDYDGAGWNAPEPPFALNQEVAYDPGKTYPLSSEAATLDVFIHAMNDPGSHLYDTFGELSRDSQILALEAAQKVFDQVNHLELIALTSDGNVNYGALFQNPEFLSKYAELISTDMTYINLSNEMMSIENAPNAREGVISFLQETQASYEIPSGTETVGATVAFTGIDTIGGAFLQAITLSGESVFTETFGNLREVAQTQAAAALQNVLEANPSLLQGALSADGLQIDFAKLFANEEFIQKYGAEIQAWEGLPSAMSENSRFAELFPNGIGEATSSTAFQLTEGKVYAIEPNVTFQEGASVAHTFANTITDPSLSSRLMNTFGQLQIEYVKLAAEALQKMLEQTENTHLYTGALQGDGSAINFGALFTNPEFLTKYAAEISADYPSLAREMSSFFGTQDTSEGVNKFLELARSSFEVTAANAGEIAPGAFQLTEGMQYTGEPHIPIPLGASLNELFLSAVSNSSESLLVQHFSSLSELSTSAAASAVENVLRENPSFVMLATQGIDGSAINFGALFTNPEFLTKYAAEISANHPFLAQELASVQGVQNPTEGVLSFLERVRASYEAPLTSLEPSAPAPPPLSENVNIASQPAGVPYEAPRFFNGYYHMITENNSAWSFLQESISNPGSPLFEALGSLPPNLQQTFVLALHETLDENPALKSLVLYEQLPGGEMIPLSGASALEWTKIPDGVFVNFGQAFQNPQLLEFLEAKIDSDRFGALRDFIQSLGSSERAGYQSVEEFLTHIRNSYIAPLGR